MNSVDTLRDARGRRIRYLRVSVTDRCNFRCRYCMPSEGIRKLRHEDMLSLEELALTIAVMVADLGIEKVRLTGGEPLVRRGILDFIAAVGRIRGIRDFALTTNAFHLASLAPQIRAAGVQRLNISLDSLQPERFRELTRVDGLAQVLRGIAAARTAGFAPIKLNTVILPENFDELPKILAFAVENNLQARFIELMPSQGVNGRTAADAHPPSAVADFIPAARVLEALSRRFDLVPANASAAANDSEPANAAANDSDPANDSAAPHGIAALYRIKGTPHTCGFITPMSCPFCEACDRVRLRGDGQLMPCLSDETHFDLKPYLRPSLRRAELAAFVRASLAASKSALPHDRRIQEMWRIGG